MKIRYLLCIVFVALVIAPTTSAFASTQDFYFSDFTADYYLTKQEDGTSNLHVKEVLTAVFPEIDQNHGITRQIPFTNQGGKNQTIKNEAALNLKVLRNGQTERINEISKGEDYFTIYIGSADEYVHGKQEYTLEYDFTNVITEFTEDGENVSGIDNAIKAFQELYWDTNGTGWDQKFDRITARLHVPTDIYSNLSKQAWCYVGRYGSKGQDRCIIEPTSDGFSFMSEGLLAGENLTFVTNFKPDTFKVTVNKFYYLVWVLIVEIIVFTIILTKNYLKWRKNAKPQYELHKSLFKAPQYQPPAFDGIHTAEAEQIYLKRTKPSYVATLLELVIDKKVILKHVDDQKKYKWTVTLTVDPGELTKSQAEMLSILNGGKNPVTGEEMPMRKHTPTRLLAECPLLYREYAKEQLENGGYLQPKKKGATKYQVIRMVVIFMIILALSPYLLPPVISSFFMTLDNLLHSTGVMEGTRGGIIVGGLPLLVVDMVIFIAAVITNTYLRKMTTKYQKYTEDGVRLVNYMEGLELYIKMAEADRLKFLQSVKGVDMSKEGIVKLYEKLLPWACLFGLEESWANELSKYYEVEMADEVINANLLNGLITSSISRDLNRVVTYSTGYYESSSSSSGGSSFSSSSSSSGGGGGGFSGGGGGGGGGGGW